ncbi:YiiX/YebB-like N1pC/P60 family cysteine hydrolase, partial [Brevibacillus sp. NL20B1]|uniref:YiiX/YebB-like N1pC/P60 family cysteine hydrolase n=1 Tax=Brevibacillus sp. NL20B1 TaxID=2829799 RepID=UPI001B8F0DA1
VEEQNTKKSRSSNGKMGTVGDILITFDNRTSGWNHGHAAIVRKNNDYIVEAWPDDGVRVYKNNWGKRFKTAYKYYVKGADEEDYVNAQKYAYSQLGKPYKLNVEKHFTKGFYCSQLVWKAWYEQGFDVDADGGFIVTPADIAESKLTVEY